MGVAVGRGVLVGRGVGGAGVKVIVGVGGNAGSWKGDVAVGKKNGDGCNRGSVFSSSESL